MNDAEIFSVINTVPTVWSGIQAETGRTVLPDGDDRTWIVTPGSFRNLQLTSEYVPLEQKQAFRFVSLRTSPMSEQWRVRCRQ